MTFEHRHYKKIAAIVAELPPDTRGPVALAFANGLRDTNPKFDRDRFLDAATGSPQGRDRP